MGYKTYGGRPCNLECIEKGPPPKVREFVRPVKFVLIEGSRKSYWYKLLFAALLSFANALLTVNFIIIFFYTTSFKNNLAMTGHIYLSTLGLQYMMFLGILSMNGLFGPSVPMKSLHKDRQHALIQLFAIVFCCLGFLILYFRSKKGTLFSTAHSIIGVIATALAVTVFVAGVLAYFKKEEPPAIRTKLHNILATPAVIASTCCFLTGIAKPGFRNLMPMTEVFMIEPRAEYCRTVWAAVAVGLTHAMIGAAVMPTIMYSLHSKDIHVALCTAGCHFFLAEAILSFSYLSGWSSHMRIRHRVCAHISLQLCGIVCITIGCTLVFINRDSSLSAHGVTGIVATVSAIVAAIFGVTAWLRKKCCFILTHVSFGILTLLVSSVCVCLGFVTDVFVSWAGVIVVAILIGFIVFNTLCILTPCFLRCMMNV